MHAFNRRFFSNRGPQTKGAGIVDYGLVVSFMMVIAIGTVSVTGKEIKALYHALGLKVAYVNREIATINIAMDNSSGSWVIVDTEVAPVVEEEVPAEEPVTVEPSPEVEQVNAPAPEFRLTKNNGKNVAEIDFSKIDVPYRAYEFTIFGTGDTKPTVKAFSDGTETEGSTLVDKIQIRINKPAKGEIETITLIIAGQTLTWTVTHDNGTASDK